jgi:ABC-type nitrate/sulfonate/bicarbonate transport system substrate-binding protein
VLVKIAAAVAALLLAAGPLAAPAQNPPLTEVTYVTGTASSGEWVTFLAQRRGFFRAEGLQVSTVYAGAPPTIVQSLATGAAQFGHNGVDSWIVAVAGGVPIKFIGGIVWANTFQLLVTPEIKTWNDLRGKTVMLGTKQDITAIVLAQLARSHNLTLDDFSIAIGGNSTARYAALMSGHAQAAILAQPFDILAEGKGMVSLGNAMDAMKEWTSSGIAVNPAWAATHHDAVVRFMRALRKAMQYGYTHKAEAIEDLIAELKIDPAVAQRAYEDDWVRWKEYDPDEKFTPASFRYMTGIQQAMGILKTVPTYDALYDGSYVREAVR